MSDAEAALAALLDGKFFWEPTTNPEETTTSRNITEIRRAQKKFYGNAKQISSRTCEPITAKWTPGVYTLTEAQKPYEELILAIAQAYELRVYDIMRLTREYQFQPAKRHLYWAMDKYHKLSKSEIGRILNRNHTSILNGIDVFNSKYDVEKVAQVEFLMGGV